MTEGGRLALAIALLADILDSLARDGAAADTLLARGLAQRRFAGAKDRAAVRALVYDWLRHLESLRWLAGPEADARTLAIAAAHVDGPSALALFGAGGHAPPGLSPAEATPPARTLTDAPPWVGANVPHWLWTRLAGQGEAGQGEGMQGGKARGGDDLTALVAGLNARAPLDVLVNIGRASRHTVMAALGAGELTPHSPLGLRLPGGYRIEDTAVFRDGLVEPQDEGSQIASLLVDPCPGETVVDLCAGAGGKALALSTLAGNRTRLILSDVDGARLARARPRLARWGATGVEARVLDAAWTALADVQGKADAVLVDAPCSGTGTWRRNPEARFRLTPARLDRLVEVQRGLIQRAAGLLRPGGRLVYVVCSLLAEEGCGHETAARAAGLAPASLSGRLPPSLVSCLQQCATHCVQLAPHRTGTDGFTLALFSRIG